MFQLDVVVGKDGAIRDAQVVASASTAARLKELQAMKGTPGAVKGDQRLAKAGGRGRQAGGATSRSSRTASRSR